MESERIALYPAADWRLILDGEADGATNMAIDQAILEAVVEGSSQPTLRFYAWSPPCLSLGRSQHLADVDLIACRRAGVDIVRRPTGGRAILHTDELTYSVTLPQSDPRAAGGSIVEGYRRLSEGLLAGLQWLAVPAVQARGSQQSAGEPTAVCFETPADYEITVKGRKLVGSAQWRAGGGVLQHGSLPLRGELGRIIELLAFSDEERKNQKVRLHQRAITLEEAVGRALSYERVAEVLAVGFAKALNVRLASGRLTPREQSLADRLRRERYARQDWTQRL
jgi:lipoate-protein ligase A